jgi:hypothetical protein
VKDISLFGKSKNRPDGLNVYCNACANQKSRDYVNANREKKRAAVKKYDDANRAKIKAWRDANAEKMKAYWAEYSKEYRATFKAETAAKTRRQQAARRKAVPIWLDKEKEAEFYREAQERRSRGEEVEVDHIIPINGKYCSGLHWHGNLRVISSFENRSKGNRMDLSEHPLAFAREGMNVATFLAGGYS